MSALAHREEGCGLRPRHPIVCALDMAGFVIMTALLVAYPQKFAVSVLPMSLATLYVVSSLFHWLPHSTGLQKADHCMIAVVIAVTYVPLWGTQLPYDTALARFCILGLMFAGVLVTKLLFIEWRALGSVAFLLLGFYPVSTSAYELGGWLPKIGWWCFVVGVALYALQQAVYVSKWPNPWHELFGFREVQHSILLVATSLHSWTVLAYL